MGRSKAGRVDLATVVLAFFVVFAVVVIMAPSPIGRFAQAQQPSPSPTGPRIKFLNPSGVTSEAGPGTEISAKNDGTNTTYHLVAWVGSVPSNPTVQFRHQTGTDPDVTIGSGTLRGTDTWDLQWDLSNPLVADGDYTLKAILFSGSQEMSRAELDVTVNNASTAPNPLDQETSEPQGETVEITYPTIAGPFGAFRKPGTTNPYAGVIDATMSADTIDVRAYYTTTAPGSEPNWVECGSETAAQAADGVRCTLAAGVLPTAVTAVATAVDDDGVEPQDCDLR